jgi:hypothetical protein
VQNQLAEFVVAEHADPGRGNPEAGEANRHIAFRSADGQREAGGVPKPARARRHHQRHRFPRRDHPTMTGEFRWRGRRHDPEGAGRRLARHAARAWPGSISTFMPSPRRKLSRAATASFSGKILLMRRCASNLPVVTRSIAASMSLRE